MLLTAATLQYHQQQHPQPFHRLHVVDDVARVFEVTSTMVVGIKGGRPTNSEKVKAAAKKDPKQRVMSFLRVASVGDAAAAAGAGATASAAASSAAKTPRQNGGPAAIATSADLVEVADSDDDPLPSPAAVPPAAAAAAAAMPAAAQAPAHDVAIAAAAAPAPAVAAAAAAPAAAQALAPAVAAALDNLPPIPRTKRPYKPEEQAAVLAVLAACNGSVKAAEKAVRLKPGYETVSRATIARFRATALAEPPKKQRGRKVNKEFEQVVRGNLLFTIVESVGNKAQAKVVASAAHSYAMVKRAAEVAQQDPAWAGNADVQNLTFGNGWIRRFLVRQTLMRRRATAVNKATRPPADEVNERMASIQSVITSGGYTPDCVISADETGICIGAQPNHQFVPMQETARGLGKSIALDGNGGRGSVPDSDDKARFTCVMWGAADGVMGPPFVIIKCTAQQADLSRTTVLNKLLGELNGAGAVGGGWERHMWERKLTLKVKGQVITAVYKRPYLLHPPTLTVVTIQHKAWMDSVGMTLWADTQMAPWAKGRKVLIVWDNCGPHNVEEVKAVFEKHNIATESLPLNMTDQLQVMDLVVNGPLKAAIRRARCSALFEYLQQFKVKWLQEQIKPVAERSMPKYDPPKPKLLDGLQALFDACKDDLTTAKFQSSMQRTFVNVGLTQDKEGRFFRYTGKAPVSYLDQDAATATQFQLHDISNDHDVDVVIRDEGASDDGEVPEPQKAQAVASEHEQNGSGDYVYDVAADSGSA